MASTYKNTSKPQRPTHDFFHNLVGVWSLVRRNAIVLEVRG